VGLSAAVVLLLNYFLLRPLQEAGVLQGLAVTVNALCTIGGLFGMLVGRGIFVTDHHLLQQDLSAFFVVSALASGAFFGGVTLALLWSRSRRLKREEKSSGGRRGFIKQAASLTLLTGAGSLGLYSMFGETRWPRIRRLRLDLPGLPRGLCGMRVVQLTDLHLGWLTPAAYLRRVVELTNGLSPDLVLLTGDYVYGSPRFLEPVARIIASLRTRLGLVGVLGNHEHWVGIDLSRPAIRSAGVRLVDNTRVWVGERGLCADEPAGGGLCLAGVGDYWEDRHDLEAALAGVDPARPRILLCHNPDFAESVNVRDTRHRVDLMLSGHTHGGQVRLPGTRSIITPSRYGSKYASGWVQGPAFPVYVSPGIGLAILPVRFLVRPEITVFQLESAPPRTPSLRPGRTSAS